MKAHIGFFDILGYQAFLKNNTAEGEIQKVLEVISRCEKEPSDFLKVFLGRLEQDKNGQAEKFKDIHSRIKWVVFSDTIICTLPTDTKYPPAMEITAFILSCMAVTRSMFEYGLPMRGHISTGEVFQEGHSLAGQAIVDSYQAVQHIDAAIVTIDPSFNRFCSELQGSSDILSKFLKNWICDYHIPTKTSGYVKHSCLSYGLMANVSIRDYVYKSFWAHKKSLDAGAVKKADETERFLLYCRLYHSIKTDLDETKGGTKSPKK